MYDQIFLLQQTHHQSHRVDSLVVLPDSLVNYTLFIFQKIQQIMSLS